MLNAITSEKTILLIVICSCRCSIHEIEVVLPRITLFFLFIIFRGFCAPPTLECRRSIALSRLILTELVLALSFEFWVQLIFNAAVGGLNFQEHLLCQIVIWIKIWVILFGLVKVRFFDLLELRLRTRHA